MNLRKELRVRPGEKLKLAGVDSGATPGDGNHETALPRLEASRARLGELQELLWAEGRRSVLVVLQGMDAAGKDGTIAHVMSGLNPQGCTVTSFKAPTAEELAHDFLWRVHRALPRAGQIGIFNRSHYEDVLIARVRSLVPEKVWKRRYRQINDFERLLTECGVTVVKFFLHISKDEQKRRFQARLAEVGKNWKISPADYAERPLWDAYVEAYEEALTRCSSADAPWYVIPSDHKWFRNLAVAEILVATMERMRMRLPEPQFDRRRLARELAKL